LCGTRFWNTPTKFHWLVFILFVSLLSTSSMLDTVSHYSKFESISRIDTHKRFDKNRASEIEDKISRFIRCYYLVLIFIVFVLSSKIAVRCWLLLVLYCSAVITLVYFWNFSWTSHLEGNFWTKLIGTDFQNLWLLLFNSQSPAINLNLYLSLSLFLFLSWTFFLLIKISFFEGLRHYSNYDLVFGGLLWHLVIFLFSVIQWRLIVYVRQIQGFVIFTLQWILLQNQKNF
jgi:hypothetical protein